MKKASDILVACSNPSCGKLRDPEANPPYCEACNRCNRDGNEDRRQRLLALGATFSRRMKGSTCYVCGFDGFNWVRDAAGMVGVCAWCGACRC